jgi:hypothetical protein
MFKNALAFQDSEVLVIYVEIVRAVNPNNQARLTNKFST